MKKTVLFILLTSLAAVKPTWTKADTPLLSCPEKPTDIEKTRKLAGSLFSEAETAFDANLHLKALKRFLCSMMMIEHENTVINIEKTIHKLSDKSDAVPLLRAYAKQASDGIMTGRIISIADGIEEEATRKPTPECDCPECTSSNLECPPSLDCSAERAGIGRVHRILSMTGWIDVSVGAAAFVTAIVLQGIAGAKKNQALSATNYDAFLDAKDRNKSFQIAATSMFIASALVAGTGLAHLLILNIEQKKLKNRLNLTKDSQEKDVKKEESKPKVTLLPGPTWFGIEGTF